MLELALPRDADALPRICDPAVGEGVFLVEAVELLVRRTGLDRRAICERCIVGVDVDARAIEVARRALPGADLRVGDALTMAWSEMFDLVIGNPPYVRQEHLDDKAKHHAISLENVVAQIAHLRTHPSVAAGIARLSCARSCKALRAPRSPITRAARSG